MNVQKSIKTKVVFKVSIFIFILLSIAISFIIYLTISNMQEKTNYELKNKAQELSKSIELRLEYLKESAELLANNEFIINAFIDQSDKDKYLLSLINNFKNGKYLHSLSVVDFDGRVIFQTEKDTPKFKNSKELRLSLASTQTVLYLKTKEKEIVFIVPIKYYNTTQGAIIATYNMDKIIQRYNDYEDFIYTKFFKDNLEYYSKNYHEDETYYKYDLFNNLDYEILNKLNITSEIGMLNSVYIEPLKTLLWILLLFGVFIFIIGMLSAYYLATTITRPVLALYEQVKKRSSQNEITKYQPLGTQDELEILGHAFYEKTKELQELNENLDLKIKEALKELKKSELLKKNILETIRDLIWLKDKDGAYITCNYEFEHFFGAKESEIAGKTDYDFVEKKVADSFKYYDALAMQSEKPSINEEWVTYASDGHRALLEVTKQQFKDDDGNILGVLGISHDITERYNLQKELQVERNRFSLAIEGAQDGLWDWNVETDELFLTERFETMLGYNIGDLPQNIDAWFGLLHPDDKAKTLRKVQTYLNSKGIEPFEANFRLRAKDGSWRWILGRGKAQFNKDGKAIRFVGFNTDISAQKEYQDKLDHTAKHDSLTHLPNRFLLSELLIHSMHSAKRKNQQLALLFIDLDGFKNINDTFGHDAGDAVLTTIASRMNEIVRESDIVSRLGGDEFVIVASELHNNEVIPLLQRLLSELSSTIIYNGNSMHISVSIGVSFYPQVTDIGTEALLRQADQAMYQAKLSGKNQYQFFNLEASQELKEQHLEISRLREAITKSELVLYYQPKVNMKTNQIIGFEALLRWKHPEKGLLYPDDFLPLVEHESCFMIELGHWVFETACSQLEAWHIKGLEFTLSVNVSSHEVKQEKFAFYLKKLFARYPNINLSKLELEILETSAFDNVDLTYKILSECQNLGVSIAIDDFGTGYASLHYLKMLPINTLKIDKSFILDLLSSSKNLSIVEASIGLAHAFNSNVVAEGVESEEHGKILLQLGCQMAQGYIISKDMPASDVENWVKSWKGFSSWETIEPISLNSRTALHAAIEHNHWINTIEAFLENKTSELPQLNASNCYLGNWIAQSDSKEYHDYPEFKELKELHTKLHDYAEEILRSNEPDKSAEIKKLKELRQHIIIKLEALMNK